jgi:hypothetical protein
MSTPTNFALIAVATVAWLFAGLPWLAPDRRPVGSAKPIPVVLPGDFLVELRDTHWALFGLVLVVDHKDADGLTRATANGKMTLLTDGAAANQQAMRVRAVVTEVVSRQRRADLRQDHRRRRLQRRIRRALLLSLRLRATRAFFSDLALR